MAREICISGFASLSRDWVNDLEDHVEIWAMNEAHYYLRRHASRWFQLHPKYWKAAPKGLKAMGAVGWCETCGWGENGRSDIREQIDNVQKACSVHKTKYPDHDVKGGIKKIHKNGYGRAPAHLKWLKNYDGPVYQMKIDKRIPNSTLYPYKEIVERYGKLWFEQQKRPYLTSTAAFMLALALYEHENGDTIDTIRLAGIELAIGTEYFDQRPCVEYWIGRMEGAGIEYIPSPYGSSILSGPIYSIDHMAPLKPESMGTPITVATPDTYAAVQEDEDGNPIGL